LAHQVAEAPGRRCGRSFEEAFILANAEILAKELDQLTVKHSFTQHLQVPITPEEITKNAYAIAGSLDGKKTDFAFDILMLDGWTTPRYIAEGLQWLTTSPNE
jgi:hypothetical protein